MRITPHSLTVGLLVATVVSAVTFVREPNNRGPSAVQAGRECLTRVARSFFNSSQVSRTRNMVVMHSARMSAPAADIEVLFLADMHAVIASNSWKGLQLRIISNRHSTQTLIQVNPNAVTLTDYYVLVVDDLDSLRNSMQGFIIVGRAYNPAAHFVVMFAQPGSPLDARTTVAHNIFRLMFELFGAAKVVVCVSAGHLKYDVYQTDPYRNASDCGSLLPHLVGQCNDGQFVHDIETRQSLRVSLVPATLVGCVFTVCARVTQPYIEENCTEGLEWQLLRTLQDSMDFTQKTICSTLERGERYDEDDESGRHNGTWSDLLGQLQAKRCDLVVGGFFPDNDVHEDFAVTNTYMQDTYTWYVYLAALQAPWRGLLAIFEPQTWLLFYLILIIAALAWWSFGMSTPEHWAHKQPVLAALNTWSVFLSVSANNRPGFSPLRVFFVMLALYGLNVTTLYTSNLITMFTDPRHEEQLDSIHDILAAELPIGGREEYSDWFENDSPHDRAVRERYNSTDAFMPRADNLRHVRDGRQAMLMNRFYVLSSSLRDSIYAVQGNVFSNPLEMIALRGFPLLPAINQLLNRMKDAGLVMKIHADFLWQMDLREATRAARQNQGEETLKVLTVDHLQGAFAVWICGNLLAAVVFAMELVTVTERWRLMCAGVREAVVDLGLKVLVGLRLAERPEKPRKRLSTMRRREFQVSTAQIIKFHSNYSESAYSYR